MTNENKTDERSKAEILLERKRLRRLQSVELLPKDKNYCDHPWHNNPGLIIPCPECGEE